MKRKINKQAIKFAIDVIEKEDKITLVTGWGYDSLKDEPVDIAIIGKESDGVRVIREQRTDVNKKLSVNLEKKLGFKIIFSEAWLNKTVKLKLYNEKVYAYKNVNLKKVSLNNTRNIQSKLQKVSENIEFGFKYLKENGLARTLKRAKAEIFSRQLDEYYYWMDLNEKDTVEKMQKDIETFKLAPKISIVIPVYDTDERLLKECIESVFSQTYSNWELCIADDNSSKAHVKKILDEYMRKDPRVKVEYRKENGHISKASNTAIEISTGEFIALLDHDDTLAPCALYKVVKLLNENPEAAFIYSDEDKLDKRGKRCRPFFKPDWSPDTILSQNYICHLVVAKKELIMEAGGFRVGYEGAQDYDLVLRCTELTDEIYHIPEILYHWRMIENSTAEKPEAKLYAFDAGQKALESAIERRNLNASVQMGKNLGTYTVTYHVSGNPKVSIIIPTREYAKDLEKCINSIVEKTNYDNYEIIIVDNGSKEKTTLDFFKRCAEELKDKLKIITLDIPFNYSTLNNKGIADSAGEYIVLLNNDIEIITPNWLEKMLGYAQQPHIGGVGAKLLYEDGTIQHAGVVLGIGGVAGHSHKYLNAKSPGYFGRVSIDANYSAVTAACLMVSKENFLNVGGLDEENLAIAFNDVDFCLKLLENKLYNICLAQVECYHYESKSRGTEDTKEQKMRFQKEVLFMKEKWKAYIAHDSFYNKNLTLRKEDYSINIED